ncbi:MAG: hypothetical protein ACWA44_02605 [Thiotrichales bacterium]
MNDQIDLFEQYEQIPANIQAVLDQYDLEGMSYGECKSLLSVVEALGYTFEYDLDAEPYNLRKVTKVVAKPKAYSDCRVQRMKLVTSYKVTMSSFEEVPGTRSKEWVSEPCGTPLFTEERMEEGICRSCAKGWKVDGNYPVDTPENRDLVPHYFREEKKKYCVLKFSSGVNYQISRWVIDRELDKLESQKRFSGLGTIIDYINAYEGDYVTCPIHKRG